MQVRVLYNVLSISHVKLRILQFTLNITFKLVFEILEIALSFIDKTYYISSALRSHYLKIKVFIFVVSLQFFSIMSKTPVVLKPALSVLFFRTKQIRVNPSHSLKLIGGGGFRGSIRTTDDSTFGGGRKLFFPTYNKQI